MDTSTKYFFTVAEFPIQVGNFTVADHITSGGKCDVDTAGTS